MEGNGKIVVALRREFEFAVMQQIGGELADVHHARGAGILESCPGDGRNGFFEKISRAVHGVHILVEHAPHVSAFAAQNPLHSQAAGFFVDFCIQPLRHLVGGEQAEVAALGGITRCK